MTIAALASAECPTGFQAGTTQTCDCTASSIPCSAVTTECLCPTFDCNVQHQGHYGTFTQSNVGLFAQFNSTVKQDTPFVAGAMSSLVGAMKTCYSKYVDARSKTASSAILAACTPADQDKYGKPPHTGIVCCAGLVEVSEDRPLNRPAAERLAHPKIQMCRKKTPVQALLQKWDIPTGHRLATGTELEAIDEAVLVTLKAKLQAIVDTSCPAGDRNIKTKYIKQFKPGNLDAIKPEEPGLKKRDRLSTEFSVESTDATLDGASIMSVEVGCCWNSMTLFKATQRTNATTSDVIYNLQGGIRFPRAASAGDNGCGSKSGTKSGARVSKTCCVSTTNPTNQTMFLAVDNAFRAGLIEAKFTKGQAIITAEGSGGAE